MLKYNFKNIEKNDCDLIFEWANDETVRNNSFNSNTIEYEEHVKWFDEKLKSTDSIMHIFEVNNVSVGLIRLDRFDDKSFLINYSIAKEHRGRGYATYLLQLIKDKYKTNFLIGKVKSTNSASIKAFMKAGYIMKDESDIKLFYSFDRD
ncbi:GNAT family N-acetyltransferase [Alkaliphilus oremlandii]|uniref:GCN5-related N-acetyltransferase n=1 Tax=Alkaliphilus oremlandii (strain OhILAs) TaxID=350688 RepID=A8MJR0_ALKOO|nr:GNAT family N-acetyltransferase [Alkaliphilus oremlandii]ABW20042.1 GCN5-related N-acetyltransferase [Alkaliphilus oremlandii OhILAs]